MSIFDEIPEWVANIVTGCGRIRCEMSMVLTDGEAEEIKRLGAYRNQFLHSIELGIYENIVVPKGCKLVGIYDGVTLLQKLPIVEAVDDLCLI